MKSSHSQSVLQIADNVTIQIIREGTDFLGFGEIIIAGQQVRSNSIPMRVHLSTPTGIVYTRFEISRIDEKADETRLCLRAHGQHQLHGDICDDYDFNLVFPSQRANQEVVDEFIWIFRPIEISIDGELMKGFSYAVEFQSSERKIYQMTFVSTFELGGSIEDITLLHQGQCNPPAYTGTQDSSFTTDALKSIGKPYEGEPGLFNHSMQMNSRHGVIQSFDYQYSKHGVLTGIWERGEYVRSLIQKNSGETVLFIIDEHHVPYGAKVRTCAKQILFAPIADPLRARDLWKAIKDHVQLGYQRQWGFQGMPLRTEAGLNEGWIGIEQGQCWFNKRLVPHENILRVLADEWLPQCKAAGHELAGFGPFAESDVTQMGNMTKLQRGIHGDLCVSSVCGVWRYWPADYWGGMDAWRYFADRSHDMGLKVGVWVGNHVSRNAPVMREHPEWFSTGRNGRANMGGYTSLIGAPLDWNSGGRSWVVDSLKRWRDEGGLDYIFLDSWGNIGQQPIHYERGFTNNLDGMGKLIAELQDAGFEYVTNEGMGPFCPPRFGLGTHQTMAEGQNSIFWWFGNEDMADGLSPCVFRFEDMSEEQAHSAHFRFFANYALFCLSGMKDEIPEELRKLMPNGGSGSWLEMVCTQSVPAYYDRLMRIWPQIRDNMYMRRRTTLPDGRGVFWSGGHRDVLWSYKTFDMAIPAGKKISQIYPSARIVNGNTFRTDPLSVYVIE